MGREDSWCVGLFATICLAALMFLGVGCDDDGECLVNQENCSQQYIRDNYGTTDIGCCEGTCWDGGGGSLICR